MSLRKILIMLGMVIVLAVIITACATATPTPAPTEPPAPTQTPAPTPVPVTPTQDQTAVIAAAVEASAHTDDASAVFHDWDSATPAEVPTTCAKCHSEAGYIDFITDGKVNAAVPAPQGVFSCNLCHNDAAKALTSVTFPSGAVIENLGPEAICMTCHQGRESKISVDAKLAKFGESLDPDAIPVPYKDDKGNDVKLGFSNVHYYAAAGTLYGSQTHTGYEYDGKLYDVKHQHVDGFNTCIGCHDQHSLQVKVDACRECHGETITDVESLKNIREPSSAKDYDGDGDKTEGVAHEIEGLQAILLSSMQAYAKEVIGTSIAYDPAAYPYWFVDADGDGVGDTKDGAGVAYNGLWTPRLLKAAYNYQVSIKDPGAFAHGGKYIIELLYDSIEDINSSEKLTTKFDVTTLTREDAGHFDGAGAAWRHWDVDSEGKPVYTVEAACAKCHSASGLPTLIAGGTIPEEGVPAGNGLMCLTCHDGANFPARQVVNEVTLPSTKVVSFGEGADSNLCIMCHQGRASKKIVDDRIAQFNAAAEPDKVVEAIKDANGNDVKFGFINSHYLGIANEWFGTDAQGAYEYDGKTYVGTNPHIAVDNKPGCVGCHDVHNGEVKVELCKQCHSTDNPDDIRGLSDATIDYNGNGDTKEGIRNEYRVLRDVLYAELQNYAKKTVGTAIVYNADAYPYWYEDANKDGKLDAGDTKPFTTWTPRLLKAAYNYNFFRKTPGAYAHNAKYSIQIIFDSIEDLGGDVSKYVRP